MEIFMFKLPWFDIFTTYKFSWIIIFTLREVLGASEAKSSDQAAAKDTHTNSHALVWPTDMMHWQVAGLGEVPLF